MEITIGQLKHWGACPAGHKKVIAVLGEDYGEDTPIKLLDILNHDTSTAEDVLWIVSEMKLTTNQQRDFRLFACGCAERVLPIYEKEFPNDLRVRECIKVAKQYALGVGTEEDLDAAEVSARDAAEVSARDGRAAAWAAGDDAAQAASEAGWYAKIASRDAERKTQKTLLIDIVGRY